MSDGSDPSSGKEPRLVEAPTSATTPSQPETPDEWTTTRDQWSIRGVYFDAAGWRLVHASETSMSWVGLFGGTMTFTKVPGVTRASQPIDLQAARREHRERAAQVRGGLVSVEAVDMVRGPAALEVLTKHPRGAGFAFEGILFIDDVDASYTLQIAIDEAETGTREAIVNGLRMKLGEIDLFALMAASVAPRASGVAIPGMQLDPYDPAYDDQATYSASDDPRIDEVMQTHPLAVIRSTFRRAERTWEPSGKTDTAARPRSPSHSAGPRVVLSETVVRELYRIAQR